MLIRDDNASLFQGVTRRVSRCPRAGSHQLTRADCAQLFPTLHSATLHWYLEISRGGASYTTASAIATNQSFYLFFLRASSPDATVRFPPQGLHGGWDRKRVEGKFSNGGRPISLESLLHSDPFRIILVLVCKVSAERLSLPRSVPPLEQGRSVRLSFIPHLRLTRKPSVAVLVGEKDSPFSLPPASSPEEHWVFFSV